MLIRVDAAGGRPIYEQIVMQVTYAVAAGSLRAGDPVPSVRELAAELLVNPNTVARAYRELQAEGVLEARRGLGLYVTNGAPNRSEKARTRLIGEQFKQLIREATEAGLSKKEIRDLASKTLRELGGKSP